MCAGVCVCHCVCVCVIRCVCHQVACCSCLLVVGETAHDGWVHYAVEQHGEGIDRKVGVILVSLHNAGDLLIGQLHCFHCVLQGANLLLQNGGNPGGQGEEVRSSLTRAELNFSRHKSYYTVASPTS